MNAVLDQALALAEDGFPVFPCAENKHPLTVHGFRDATTDPNAIAAWWEQHVDALVAVPTGRTSGILVIDIDPGGAEWYREHAHDLRCGRVHQTRRGHHLLFRYPDIEIRNSAGKIAPGIDVRGEGGFFIWWPAHGLEAVGDLADLTSPPAWLLKLANGVSSDSGTSSHSDEAKIREGERNDWLSREAFRYRRQGRSVEQILKLLRAANEALCQPPLEDKEVVAIVRGKSNVEADPEPSADDGVIITRGDNLKVESIDWLWSEWLARRKLHILAGAPGAGKSTIAIGLAATVTSGGGARRHGVRHRGRPGLVG